MVMIIFVAVVDISGAEALPVEYTSHQVRRLPYGHVRFVVAPPCHQILKLNQYLIGSKIADWQFNKKKKCKLPCKSLFSPYNFLYNQ